MPKENETVTERDMALYVAAVAEANNWNRTGTVLSPKTAGDDIAITGQINLGSVGANIITATNANGDLRLGAGGGTNDLKIDINGNVDIFENLTVAGTATGIAPTVDLHLATKKYVDDNVGAIRQIAYDVVDNANPSTSSTSYVDVPNLSLSITPTQSDSVLICLSAGGYAANRGQIKLLDFTNTVDIGATSIVRVEGNNAGEQSSWCIFGKRVTGAATAITIKAQLRSSTGGNFQLVRPHVSIPAIGLIVLEVAP